MLQTIRDKITGVVAMLFLGAIGLVFVFWGIDFKSGTQSYALKVEGQKIPVETVRRAWQDRQSQLQQMLRNELPPEMVKSQQDALVEQFIRQTLLTQRAKDSGYRVSDQALARRIMEIPVFQVDGKFSKDRYFSMLRARGMTEPQFEAELQTELLIQQMQTAVVDSAFLAPYELERRYALEKQEREIEYALIPASDFSATATVSDEQIQKWYEQNKSRYLTAETVDLQYIELDRSRSEAAVNVTEQELKDYYEQVKDRFETPERRRARHILVTVDDKTNDAAALEKAEELTAKAKAGADFAQLAQENSQDTGSAQQGGDLGFAQRGTMVGPFEEALFAMSPGEIRGPVKTQFGYHVIKLEEVEATRRQSFEEARAGLESELRNTRSQTQFYDETQKLGDTAFASLTELDSVAKTMNLPIRTVTGFTRQGGGDLGQDPSVIEAAFSEDVLERRQNSPLLTIGDDRALVLRVTNHKPAEPRPLAEVRGQIQTQLKTEAERDAAAKKGADAVARLQKGESWSAVGITPVGKRFVSRQDGIAPPAVVRAAFNVSKADVSEAKPYYAGTITDDGNYAVYAVTQVRSGDPAAEPPANKTARQRNAERQLGNEEFAAYVAEVERTADVDRNEKIFVE